MNRDGHNSVEFFIGPEVEHTPAFSKKTLFVVGRQDATMIEKHARDNKTPHIFMGANHSFDIDPLHPDTTLFAYWDKTITALLDKGFMVTLDYQAHIHNTVQKVLNPGIWQSRLFVPLLSVRITNIETSSPNLTVKIDDIDFKATNRGVWCMHFHEVTDSNRFTDWSEYESDSVLAANEVIAPVVEKLIEKLVKVEEEKIDPLPTPVLNDGEIGLDTEAKSLLKPDLDAPSVAPAIVSTPQDAAAAYADGATSDPLGEEASKKPKGKK